MVQLQFQLVIRIWPGNWPLTVILQQFDRVLLKVGILQRFATVVVFGLYRT